MTKLFISEEIKKIDQEAKIDLKEAFQKVEDVCELNSAKVLQAFLDNEVLYSDFQENNGYSFFDSARDKIERIFAQVFDAEDALIRPHIMSGTNAIYITLSALLRPNDTMICITGAPYDPLQEIIGVRGESECSLKKNGINYEQIELIENDFDYQTIETRIKQGGIKLIEIQRSCGYSDRRGLAISQIEKVCKLIKALDSSIIIMCDNCYGELVEEKEPTSVGVDIVAGSLMHNLGGGIASSGGYIIGKRNLIELCADRLTAPGVGKYLGANYNQNMKFLKGLFLASRTVANAVKTAIYTSYFAEKLGFENIRPKFNEHRSDIIQNFNLKNKEQLIKFCQCLQSVSPVDSIYTPIPAELPAYPHDEIMSAGTFSQGSTIELTCDAPVCPPYKVFVQGGIVFECSKLSIMSAFSKLLKNEENEKF